MFIRCVSGFVQIVFNFFQILSSIHRVHGCDDHFLPVPSEAFSFWDQSTFDNGVHFESVPDVVDVLSHPATVHCLATMDQQDYLTNVPELLGGTGI